jgi:hypothetical protein
MSQPIIMYRIQFLIITYSLKRHLVIFKFHNYELEGKDQTAQNMKCKEHNDTLRQKYKNSRQDTQI